MSPSACRRGSAALYPLAAVGRCPTPARRPSPVPSPVDLVVTKKLGQFVSDLGRDAGAVVAHPDLDSAAEVARGHLQHRVIGPLRRSPLPPRECANMLVTMPSARRPCSAIFSRLPVSMLTTSSIFGAFVLIERRHRLPRRFLQTRARRGGAGPLVEHGGMGN